jgi:DNA-binding Lrp family transcriptional regulator
MKPRGNKTSKAERAERQARALELMKSGETQEAIAEVLGVSRTTFWRDLQAIEARFVAGSNDDVKQFKEAQYQALMKIEQATANGTIEPDVANALTRIRDSVAKLLGLNAPTKSIVGHVSGPKLDSLYLDIREVLLDLSDGDKQEALLLMREFAKTHKKPVVITAKFISEGNSDAQLS